MNQVGEDTAGDGILRWARARCVIFPSNTTPDAWRVVQSVGYDGRRRNNLDRQNRSPDGVLINAASAQETLFTNPTTDFIREDIRTTIANTSGCDWLDRRVHLDPGANPDFRKMRCI
jgi:hypothetical protein